MKRYRANRLPEGQMLNGGNYRIFKKEMVGISVVYDAASWFTAHIRPLWGLIQKGLVSDAVKLLCASLFYMRINLFAGEYKGCLLSDIYLGEIGTFQEALLPP